MNASAEASHRTNVGRKDTISRCCDKGDYVGGRKTKNNSLPGVVHVCWGSKAPFRTSADDYRGRDASYLAPPAQIRTGPNSGIRLVWGFLCQGGVTPFWSSFAFHSFVRPAPRAFFRPDRILPSPSRAAAVKDGASSAPPKACP